MDHHIVMTSTKRFSCIVLKSINNKLWTRRQFIASHIFRRRHIFNYINSLATTAKHHFVASIVNWPNVDHFHWRRLISMLWPQSATSSADGEENVLFRLSFFVIVGHFTSTYRTEGAESMCWLWTNSVTLIYLNYDSTKRSQTRCDESIKHQMLLIRIQLVSFTPSRQCQWNWEAFAVAVIILLLLLVLQLHFGFECFLNFLIIQLEHIYSNSFLWAKNKNHAMRMRSVIAATRLSMKLGENRLQRDADDVGKWIS